MAEETREVKITSDQPIASRYRPDSYLPGQTYEVSAQEAKELVDGKVASYSTKKKGE